MGLELVRLMNNGSPLFISKTIEMGGGGVVKHKKKEGVVKQEKEEGDGKLT
jgi:hypothetical protein